MQRALISLFFSSLPLAIFGCLIPLSSVAQITPDGTTSTTVNQAGNDFTIEQGDRVGDNLFHSFDEFSVPTLGEAFFNNASDIANIFSRVTGSNISNIDGLLSANGMANLYLINPNGIIFGPNAQLNLGGSFFASTADSLLFEGNTEFSASNPQAAPLLTVSVPIGANFRDNPGDIVNQASGEGLEVAPEQNLTLVGGNIKFEAGIATASSGNINLGGLSEAGIVTFNDDGSLNFPENVAQAEINITNFSEITIKTFGEGNAGALKINANSVDIADSFILTDAAARANAESGPIGDAGNITIALTNGGKFNLSNSTISTSTFGEGNAGALTISAGSVDISNSSEITTTSGGGNAGALTINAADSVEIADSFITGDVGKIDIDVTNGGEFKLSNSTINTSTFGEGNAGALTISAGSVEIADSFIFTGIFGTGDAGKIDIDVTNGGELNLFNSTINTSTFGEGNAGDLTISAGSVKLTNVSGITSRTFGEGDGGELKINAADSVELSDSKITTETFISGGGDAGNLTISAGSVKLTNSSEITTTTSGGGNAGSLTINAGSVELSDSKITTESLGGGDAGTITIDLTEDLRLSNNSLISARAKGGASGGNININAKSIIAFPSQAPANGNDIIANALIGKGGNININASLFGIEQRPAIPGNGTNDIDAGSEFGLSNFQPVAIVNELPEAVVDASAQITQNPCEQGVGSEFIVTGKGGLRPNPHGTLSSDNVQVALVEPISSQQEDRESKSLETTTPEAVPAQGWIFTDTGEVMLTSYIPSAMAEAIPSTPLAQASTNPTQLATQAEKLYQNQEFDEAANLWSQAAQAFAASGDNLNQAMAWSNLALTYQQLGRWENINQAIQNSLIALNTAPENNRLVAQTLDIQGKLQRETGQPAAAIDSWQKAANIYQKLGESAALTQNSLNQAQAFQDLGLYSSACQTILASLKLENIATCQDLDRLTTEELDIKLDKITAQPSLQKVWGLRKLGDLLLLIGQPQKSRQILANSLDLAKQLNSPSEIAATYLSIGKNYHAFTTREAEPSRTKRRNNQKQALEAYRQAIASSRERLQSTESSPPSPPSLASDPAPTTGASGQTPRRRKAQGNADQERERASGGTRVQSPPSFGEDSQSTTNLEGTRYQSPPSFGEDSQSPSNLPPILGVTGAGDLGGKNPRDETPETYVYTVDLITQQQAKLNQFSLLLQLQRWSEAASLGQEILSQIANLPPNRSSVFAQINFAYSLIELLDQNQPQPPAEIKLPSVSEIESVLTTATENARILGDQRIEAYAWGDRGRLYELTEKLPLAEQSTQQAISLISTLESPDIASQYFWQLGRIQNRQGELQKAIAAYTKAYNALQSLRRDLATINPEVQFSFRDRVEPVYRELVGLNFQYAQTLGNKTNTKDSQEAITAKLMQARNVMESLQLSQLQNFFREACIEGNPQQIDQIDPNAAVIYTIVLPDKLGILLSLPNQPPKLYPVEVTQAEISEVVDKIRSSLLTPEGELGTEYQQLYDWLIRPLEAELVKNKVKTIAFVLDEELRNIPMSVLHDGQQYLIEKYAVALTSGLQLLEPKPLTEIEVNAIAAGLSKTDDSDIIPGVEEELQVLQEIGLTDQFLLNEEFTEEALQQNIVNSRSPIVHIATEALFSNKAQYTYIVAGDGQINIKEFADLLRESTFKRQKAIELLVLNAAGTGRSDPDSGKEDGQASLGLAGVALQAGVRSTLGTLWSAKNTTSTTEIMKGFYRELQQASTTKANKAEALRQAQLNLIEDTQFNHPHYWAPFILIGNWQ